ncbi:MAG: protein-disulfide reductase DsbD domain-containing protein [Candidatus Binataceae bacterium]|jgi:DsbC/DsbD-like thiol-disulfide interchange protein
MQFDNRVTAAIPDRRFGPYYRKRHVLFHPIVVAVIICALVLAGRVFAQSGTIMLPADSDSPAPASGAIQIRPANDGVDIKADDVTAAIRLAQGTVPAGGKVAIAVHFSVASGWHVYGSPLPSGEDLTPTAISFDDQLAANQSIVMPKPIPLRFEALGETLPVYQGDFSAAGQLELKPDLKPGPQLLSGTLQFQECNDSMCKMPRTVQFNLPLRIAS